jgi:HAD superfamily hydrolase (TIGR01509 family)
MKAVIFDVDGTLIDSVDFHAEAWRQALAEFGHTPTYAAIRAQIGKGGDQLMPMFLSPDEIHSQGAKIESLRSLIFTKKFSPRIGPFAKVRELFEKLRKNDFKIALGSSAKKDELPIYKEICRIGDLVDAETSAEDVNASKPQPDVFLAVLDRLGGISSEKCLVVGDSPYDAEAARSAGIKSIGVLSGGFAERDLLKAGCVAVYKNVQELLESYDKSPFVDLKS